MRLSSMQRFRFLRHFLDSANHVKRLLGQVVILAADYSIEPFDRFLKRHVLAFLSGEYLGNVEGLR